MTTLRTSFISLALYVTACVDFGTSEDVVHPRTPQRLLRYFSGFQRIAPDAKVVKFHDEFDQDGKILTQGWLEVVVAVDSADFESVLQEARRRNFLLLGASAADTNILHNHGAPPGTNGLYAIEAGTRGSSNFQVIVVNQGTRQVSLVRIKATDVW